MRVILFSILILIFLQSQNVFSQDTLTGKTIRTNEFDLLTQFDAIIIRSGQELKQKESELFYGCNKIITLSDSSYRVSHNNGSNTLLYKDINQITFYGKRKFGKGLMWGAITGAGVGVIAMLTILATTKNSSGDAGIATINYVVFSIPACALLGTFVGGIIGALSFEKEINDFTKYLINKRKEMTFKLMLKHQIYF